MVPHYSFNLHFSIAMLASFHVFVVHLDIFFGEVSIWDLCPFFNWVVCFVIVVVETYELNTAFLTENLLLKTVHSIVGMRTGLAVRQTWV